MPKPIITDRDEARKAGLLTDGRYFLRASDDTPMYLPLWYGNRLDLDGLLLFSGNEIDEHPEWPDLNDLIRDGKVKEATIYRHHEIILPQFTGCYDGPDLTEYRIRKIRKEFREHGFNVTRKAIAHNYSCWFSDLKSGFRDTKNGYHLFTPCGCNPLQFRATSLEDDLDWQTTYEW
jgi:hypothetical protein